MTRGEEKEQVSKLPQFSNCILQLSTLRNFSKYIFPLHQFWKIHFAIWTNVFINLRIKVNDSPVAFHCWLKIQLQIQMNIQIQMKIQIQIQLQRQQISFQIAAILSCILPLTADNRWQCATFNFLVNFKFNFESIIMLNSI